MDTHATKGGNLPKDIFFDATDVLVHAKNAVGVKFDWRSTGYFTIGKS